jgi:methyltransferase (TIGR00027 family)
MLTHRHSRTAEATAAIRAGHYLYDRPVIFSDPYALDLTSPWWRAVCRHPVLYWSIVRGLLAGLRPVHGWILVRDQVTEDKLRKFVAEGDVQYLLLGAGFDSIALRRPDWLDGVRIIEVDHPATQAVKLERIARIANSQVAAGFEAVPVDFERQSLVEGLAASSFDPARKTFFAWLGVIYYLSEEAITETLSGIAAIAQPGSELILDFLLPRGALAQGAGQVMSLAGAMTSRMGEHYVSFHTPEALQAKFERAGFEVLEIMSDRELDARFCANRADGLSVMQGFGIAHVRRL